MRPSRLSVDQMRLSRARFGYRTMSLKYSPPQTFVELSFFTKLSDVKLNELKLDSSRQHIHAFSTPPARLTKFNDRPILNLDYSSFAPSDDSNTWLDGYLYNVNTIEEFKRLDKLQLLREWAEEIQSTALAHPTRSNFERFYMLTFSDLKKYKFYYWVAFPASHSAWTVKNKRHVDVVQPTGTDSFYQVVDGDAVPLSQLTDSLTFVYVDGCVGERPSFLLKNYLYFLAKRGFTSITLQVWRSSDAFELELELDPGSLSPLKVSGWERSEGQLKPKLADLGSLIDPKQLADQAVDLNLKLMKWRIAPTLDLDVIKSQKVLLLGAGTLGSYVSRALMGWGVRHITFVDSGRVSYSNPVRQPLFSFEDCHSDNGQGQWKALRAAAALKEVFPGVISTGYNLEVPMVGHLADETKQKQNYDQLKGLIDAHDVVFLLMDSRESRWLPTLLGLAKDKIVINAALGFDSYLVMRHGGRHGALRLGCYYCNDVFAPSDSLTDRTLDQMCTVTRPGVALMASSLAVELLVSILQHPEKHNAEVTSTKFGEVPHQIRGFLHNYSQTKLLAPNYKHCSGCSDAVVRELEAHGWDFVRRCLESSDYLEEVSGLKTVQQEAEKALEDLDLSDWDD